MILAGKLDPGSAAHRSAKGCALRCVRGTGDCGVEVFARGRKPDGAEVVALNVSCIDGIELSKLAMTPIDGRSM